MKVDITLDENEDFIDIKLNENDIRKLSSYQLLENEQVSPHDENKNLIIHIRRHEHATQARKK